MADVTQQSYRAAFLAYIEEAQPTELQSRGKENTSGIPVFSTTLINDDEKEKIPTKENHE